MTGRKTLIHELLNHKRKENILMYLFTSKQENNLSKLCRENYTSKGSSDKLNDSHMWLWVRIKGFGCNITPWMLQNDFWRSFHFSGHQHQRVNHRLQQSPDIWFTPHRSSWAGSACRSWRASTLPPARDQTLHAACRTQWRTCSTPPRWSACCCTESWPPSAENQSMIGENRFEYKIYCQEKIRGAV